MRFREAGSFVKKALVLGTGVSALLIAGIVLVLLNPAVEAEIDAQIRIGNEHLAQNEFSAALMAFSRAVELIDEDSADIDDETMRIVGEGFISAFRGARSEGAYALAMEAFEYYFEHTPQEYRDGEVINEFVEFLIEVYRNNYEPIGNYSGALIWFGEWQSRLNNESLNDIYNHVVDAILNERYPPYQEPEATQYDEPLNDTSSTIGGLPGLGGIDGHLPGLGDIESGLPGLGGVEGLPGLGGS